MGVVCVFVISVYVGVVCVFVILVQVDSIWVFGSHIYHRSIKHKLHILIHTIQFVYFNIHNK